MVRIIVHAVGRILSFHSRTTLCSHPVEYISVHKDNFRRSAPGQGQPKAIPSDAIMDDNVKSGEVGKQQPPESQSQLVRLLSKPHL